MSRVLNLFLPYISSVGLALASLVLYAIENDLVVQFLPLNGTPLALGTAFALILLYEKGVHEAKLTRAGHAELLALHKEAITLMEGSRVIQDVNSVYSRFKASGDSAITNEYSIMEVTRLEDARIRLSINSYTQARLAFLLSKIDREGNET